jgi:predicted DNA-binding mobile mystery protein A
MSSVYKDLMLRQLDEVFEGLRAFRLAGSPRDGWLRAIREALGMSLADVAERLGVTRAMVSQYEKAEQGGSITLSTLERVADVYDCDVIYAVVPRTSLAELRIRRAEDVARRRVERVQRSMELEDQGVSEEELDHRVQSIADSLLEGSPRKLWSDRQ